MRVSRGARIGLRTVALGYLLALLALPVGFVFYKTFEKGLGAVWDALTTPNAIQALELTLLMVAVAVPLNTAFGVLVPMYGLGLCGLWASRYGTFGARVE